MQHDSYLMVEIDLLPNTGRVCHECENGTFVRDGHELVCNNCFYAPDFSESVEPTDPWAEHRKAVESHRSDSDKGRPRLPGGFVTAYHGDGLYGG